MRSLSERVRYGTESRGRLCAQQGDCGELLACDWAVCTRSVVLAARCIVSALHSWAWGHLRGHMGSTFDVDTWLGVSVLGPAGKEIALGPEISAALKAAAGDGTLTELDVPDEGVSMDDAQFKDFEEAMAAILSTGATARRAASSAQR